MIYKFEAYDPDSNPNLAYFLLNSTNWAAKGAAANASASSGSRTHSRLVAFDEYNRVVDFSLVKGWFDINAVSGFLFTKSSIDRELAETISLVIGVEDLNAAAAATAEARPQISTTTLTLKIKDVNDNYPRFLNAKQINANNNNDNNSEAKTTATAGGCENEQPIYEIYETVEENSKLNLKISQLSAIDLDKSRNITYKVLHSTDFVNGKSSSSSSIGVDRFSGLLFVNGSIDYENTKWINLTISACDNDNSPRSKSSLLNVFVRVVDQNDNAPKFIQMNTTEFRLHENNEPAAVIGQFKAYDADSGQFGNVKYKLISGDSEKFDIDAASGLLYAKRPLDREEQDLYTIMIQAIDNPASAITANQLTDSLLIRIRILDLNDNKPYCEQDKYTIETVQNVQPGTVLLQVKAIDADVGVNALLSYHLTLLNRSAAVVPSEQDLFRVNALNGQIQTNRELVGFSGVYELQLTVVDNFDASRNESSYASPSHSSSCLISVSVKEFNMHPPRFTYPNLNNSVIRIRNVNINVI